MIKKFVKVIGINFFVLSAIFGVLEIGARIFSNAILMGDSKNLFDVSDKSYFTNCKNCEAISFGTKIYTNKDGFRVSKSNMNVSTNSNKRIVIIGDSVAFAPGIKFNDSFQGLLQNEYPNYLFENRSVIGHDINHHLKTVEKIINNPIGIEKVYLIYCLNDISKESSSEIVQINSTDLERSNDKFFDKLKQNKLNYVLNKSLRNKSVFYMFLKGVLTNPSKRYFEQDLKKYTQNSKTTNIDKLGKISKILNSNGIKFSVIIAPYEYQVREGKNNINLLLPQQILSKYFSKNKIEYIDMYLKLKDFSKKSSNLYLGYDPMHFSIKGQKILFEVIRNDINNNDY